MKEISLCSEGQQPQTSLQIPGAYAWVKLLKKNKWLSLLMSSTMRLRTGTRFQLTLLRSLAVELSSSRQGMRWTNASIWYLALINSDLFGLSGENETWKFRQKRKRQLMNQQKKSYTDQKVLFLFLNNNDSLQFVLRVGLAFSTHYRRRVQKRVLPYWICSVAV